MPTSTATPFYNRAIIKTGCANSATGLLATVALSGLIACDPGNTLPENQSYLNTIDATLMNEQHPMDGGEPKKRNTHEQTNISPKVKITEPREKQQEKPQREQTVAPAVFCQQAHLHIPSLPQAAGSPRNEQAALHELLEPEYIENDAGEVECKGLKPVIELVFLWATPASENSIKQIDSVCELDIYSDSLFVARHQIAQGKKSHMTFYASMAHECGESHSNSDLDKCPGFVSSSYIEIKQVIPTGSNLHPPCDLAKELTIKTNTFYSQHDIQKLRDDISAHGSHHTLQLHEHLQDMLAASEAAPQGNIHHRIRTLIRQLTGEFANSNDSFLDSITSDTIENLGCLEVTQDNAHLTEHILRFVLAQQRAKTSADRITYFQRRLGLADTLFHDWTHHDSQ